ncbi:glycosyltransferase family 39 protein [Solidesulfovibrio sp.]
MNAVAPQLRFAVPRSVLCATILFVAVQVMAIVNIRGVADPEGYILNNSKPVPLNVYEDDGIINLYAVLGYFTDHSSKFSYLFNIGGPFLHLGRAVFAGGDALGLVRKFESPRLYAVYPEEFQRAWRFFGFYKLALFTAWLPLAVFWLGRNHFTETVGELAAWMVAGMPLAAGFEQRMKVDSPAILLGVLALLFLLQYAKSGRWRDGLPGAVLLGLSLSMKFVMLPLAVTLPAIVLWPAIQAGRWPSVGPTIRELALGCGVVGAAFVLGNPLILPGIVTMVRDYGAHIAAAPTAAGGFWSAAAYRAVHLEPFLGPVFGALFLPALALALWRLVSRRRAANLAETVVLAFVVLDFVYLYAFVGNDIRALTYYFYAASVMATLLVASLLAAGLDLARRQGRFVRGAALAGLLLAFAGLLRQEFQVLCYVTSPTNRQAALAWIRDNVPLGTSVGVPLAESADPVNALYQLDPFAYQVVNLGTGEAAAASPRMPQYVLWARSTADAPGYERPGYARVAWFEGGVGLVANDRYDLFQEEIFEVYRRQDDLVPPAAALPDAGAGRLEAALGAFARQDSQPECTILQVQSLRFFPISLDFFRKSRDTLLPLPTGLYAASLRGDGSPVAYVHNIPPLVLRLWGVKYLVAPLAAASPFAQARNDSAYGLRLAATLTPKTGIFALDGYQGQAFFFPDRPLLQEAHFQRGYFVRPRTTVAASGSLLPEGLPREAWPSALQVRIAASADTPLDCIVQAGESRQSTILAAGESEVVIPVALDGNGAVPRYECNPVRQPATFALTRLDVAPLELRAGPEVRLHSLTMRQGFATVAAGEPGQVAFAVPYHNYWTATVDGVTVPVSRGPAGLLCVRIPAGRHDVAIAYNR